MVFSRPVPLPLTIYENVSYGLEMAGERHKERLDEAVEHALRQAVLWDEVNDRLNAPGEPRSRAGSSSACAWPACLALEPESDSAGRADLGARPGYPRRKIETLLQDLSRHITGDCSAQHPAGRPHGR